MITCSLGLGIATLVNRDNKWREDGWWVFKVEKIDLILSVVSSRGSPDRLACPPR